MAFTIDYSTTDANYWRAVISTSGGVKAAGFEIRRAPGITRGIALHSMALMIRSMRSQFDGSDGYLELLRAAEAEARNG